MRETSSLIQGKRRSERDLSQRENCSSSKTRVYIEHESENISADSGCLQSILVLQHQPLSLQEFYVCLPLTNFFSLFKDRLESSRKILFQFFVNTNLWVRMDYEIRETNIERTESILFSPSLSLSCLSSRRDVSK